MARNSEIGKPEIKVNPVSQLSLPIIDLQNLKEEKRELQATLISKQIAQQPFNLEIEIPIRLNLIKISDRQTIVIIVFHHIIADGWSRGILFKEFSLLYKAFSNNLPSPLEDPTIQYVDFAVC